MLAENSKSGLNQSTSSANQTSSAHSAWLTFEAVVSRVRRGKNVIISFSFFLLLLLFFYAHWLTVFWNVTVTVIYNFSSYQQYKKLFHVFFDQVLPYNLHF